jgi:uncharacterized protein
MIDPTFPDVQERANMPTFVREIEMQPGDEQRLAVRPEHREYVQRLHADGKVRMSGPLADETGAILVYEAADEDAARALVAQDPYVEAGVVRELSLREWNVVVPAG